MVPPLDDQTGTDGTRDAERGLAFPGFRRVLQLVGRSLTLRCPNCGGRPVLQNWFKMREACQRCGLRIERDGGDYFIGSMMFNLVLSELVFAVLFVGTLIVLWPTVPWDAIEVVAPISMAAAPFVLFPFSKLTWLAFDLAMRPARPDELRGDWRAAR
jgi:uncharacterized protein (DUF983 family)